MENFVLLFFFLLARSLAFSYTYSFRSEVTGLRDE